MTLVKYAGRNYLIEFGAVTTLYTIAVVARPWLLSLSQDRALHVFVTALPVVPIWLMLAVVVRFYRRVDELEKLKLLENIAIAAGVMACLVTSYALLEDVGLPKLALTWAWPTLAVCWACATGINAIRDQ
jgi:O-antigen/teichoic acid export membrane protein